MKPSRRRVRYREYRTMTLGIVYTLVGILAALGLCFLIVWLVVTIVM